MRKILLRTTIVLFLIAGIFISIPLILSVLNKGEIAADIHKIEKAASPYLYKYHSSTFELLAGEKGDDPRLTLVQGKRSLDINVKPAVQKPAPKSTQKEPAPTTQPQETEEPAPTTETTEPEPVEEAAPDETSFLPIGTAHASESVKVINPNTKPAIKYINGATTSNVLITPNQQKVALTFEIESTLKKLPSLSINPKKLIPKQNGDEIVFTTRTNREAFALKNASLTDSKGAKPTVDLVLNRISKSDFTITFDINSSWLTSNSRVFPLTLTVDAVSLFHDRMITASPTKPDFAATEKPEFIIDVSGVEEPLRSALLARDYSKLTIGAIDASGRGKQISSELVPTANGDLKLRYTVGGSSIKPGFYDLLIQYGDDPSFIGEEEFSWGVLAMNPDQAVYRPGQEAKIDMAVLNEYGHVICHADLVLEITDPSGKVSTRSTSNSLIQVSNSCFLLETESPDYTTTYKTSSAGTYNMKLTATTTNGSSVVTDKFTVNPNSPFYVKRIGPTRNYPPKTYTMHMSIEANQNASKIVETVPNNFEIEDSSEFTLSKDGKQTLTWKKQIHKGAKIDISYKFKGPHISPALFFVGPVQIGSWREPRVWQIASDAIGFVQSNSAAGRNINTIDITIAAAGANSLLVAICSSKNPRIYYTPSGFTPIHSESGDPTQYSFYKIAAGGETSVTCFTNGVTDYIGGIVHEYSGIDTTTPLDSSASATDVTTSDSDTSTVECPSVNPGIENHLYVAGLIHNANTSVSSWSNSFTQREDVNTNAGTPGSRIHHSSADKFPVSGTQSTVATTGTIGAWRCHTIAFNESAEPAGPTNSQLMRHGKWFDGTATPEQPMTF